MTTRNTQEQYFVDWIDELYNHRGSTMEQGDLLPAQLGRTTDDFTICLEVTINIPMPALSMNEVSQVYSDLWAQIKKEYNAYSDMYLIELCKSGQPHIHGYMYIDCHKNIMKYDEELFLQGFVRRILLRLPKKLWKTNIKKVIYNPGYRMIKCPAVCLNLKSVLSSNWENYILKNAPKIKK